MLNNIRFIAALLLYPWVTSFFFIPISFVCWIMNIDIDFWKLITNKMIDFLGVNIHSISEQKRVNSAFFLANHRSWGDFFIDPILSESTVISRHAATMSVLPGAIIGMFAGRFISINRKKTRSEIFGLIENHIKQNRYYSKRILFFPEGTRKSHAKLDSLEETEEILKPGLLKSIYEFKKMPVQLQITKNKENVFNERTLKAWYGVTVYTSFSEPIYPEDYQTFEDFYKHVCLIWFNQFNTTMSYT
jgi:1-acyl-sn-glycerol-3-phosphate acyltransferase